MTENTRRAWAQGPLYLMLCKVLPEHVTSSGVLDIRRLSNDLRRSHEAIYKWLRTGHITSENASRIVNLMTRNPPQVKGYRVPELTDFLDFFPKETVRPDFD